MDAARNTARQERGTLGVMGGMLIGLLKLGKIGGTLLTMLISVGVYSMLFGWRYAAGFVTLILVHELGHYLTAVQRGLPVSLPTFIPFFGAWIELKEQPMDVETEAYVASGGPFLGTVAALVVYIVGIGEQSPLMLALAYSGFMINFFNLIPLSPLDGGRITAILSPRIWFIGVPIMLGLMLYRPSPLLIVLAFLAVPALLKAWRHDPSDPETQRYYATTTSMRIRYGAFYLGLAAFLAIMAGEVHGTLQTMIQR